MGGVTGGGGAVDDQMCQTSLCGCRLNRKAQLTLRWGVLVGLNVSVNVSGRAEDSLPIRVYCKYCNVFKKP